MWHDEGNGCILRWRKCPLFVSRLLTFSLERYSFEKLWLYMWVVRLLLPTADLLSGEVRLIKRIAVWECGENVNALIGRWYQLDSYWNRRIDIETDMSAWELQLPLFFSVSEINHLLCPLLAHSWNCGAVVFVNFLNYTAFPWHPPWFEWNSGEYRHFEVNAFLIPSPKATRHSSRSGDYLAGVSIQEVEYLGWSTARNAAEI